MALLWRSLAPVLLAACLTGCTATRGGTDLAWKKGAHRGRKPLPRDWPGTIERSAGPWRIGATTGVEVFDGALETDPAFFVAPTLTVPLRRDWELEVPVRVAFASADVLVPDGGGPSTGGTGAVRRSRSGQIISVEAGLRKRLPLRGPWSARLGAGAGVTFFSGFGGADDTAFSASLGGGLSRRVSDRMEMVLDLSVPLLFTDFNGSDSGLHPALVVAIGFAWSW